MTPTGAVTTLYSFPYDTATFQAPIGAFPTAGLIQGSEAFLYASHRIGDCPAATGRWAAAPPFAFPLPAYSGVCINFPHQ